MSTLPAGAAPGDASALPALQAELDAAYAAAPAAPRVDQHRIFLLLYRFTTLRWIAFAEESPFRAFHGRLLVAFFRRYRDYVFEPSLGAPAASPNWAAYFRAARAYARAPGPLNRARLLYEGSYAHTRHDLGEAIAEALRAEGPAATRAWLGTLEAETLGPSWNAIFLGALHDFVRHAEAILPECSFSLGRRALSLYFVRHPRWWLPRFHRWRAAAWDDALAALAAGGGPGQLAAGSSWLRTR